MPVMLATKPLTLLPATCRRSVAQGGPGASSLAGVFGENGPLILADNGTLIENPYAWNKNANYLAVEFSTGIGYSYCNNSTRTDPAQGCVQGDDNCSPCLSSDSSVAAHNVAFLEGFLGVFPELKGRPLFLTGESYAGVYGPTLAQAILEHFDDTSQVNLSGMWLTDPCIDNGAQYGWLDFSPDFLFQSGLIDAPLHQTLTGGECDKGRTPVGDRLRKVESKACRAAWRLYDIAVAGIGDSVHPERNPIPFLPMYIDPLNAIGPSGGPNTPAFLASLRGALPGASQSKNQKYQIEIGNNGYYGYTSEYAACNPTPSGPLANSSMLEIYRTLAQHTIKLPAAANFKRIIVSSGDVDSVVALHGTEAGVRKIGFPQAESGRLPWFWYARRCV